MKTKPTDQHYARVQVIRVNDQIKAVMVTNSTFRAKQVCDDMAKAAWKQGNKTCPETLEEYRRRVYWRVDTFIAIDPK